MERPASPDNIKSFLEAKMSRLIQSRIDLRAELGRVDGEIGKLDLLMNRPNQRLLQYDLNYEPVTPKQVRTDIDLDTDSMSKPLYKHLLQ